MKKLLITVWNESDEPFEPYPQGINHAIAGFLRDSGEFAEVREALQSQPEQGLSDEILANTDVLVYWAHKYHGEVSDTIVDKIYRRVLDGMGLILLHSAHASKIFSRLVGTDTAKLRWRDVGELERVWCIEPHHPIAQGVPEYINIPHSEMYGENFQIPAPDELVFISWYAGGEVFRSGCTFKRGAGKMFFFSPGHETHPIYYMPEIQRVIINSIKWAATPKRDDIVVGHTPNFIG